MKNILLFLILVANVYNSYSQDSLAKRVDSSVLAITKMLQEDISQVDSIITEVIHLEGYKKICNIYWQNTNTHQLIEAQRIGETEAFRELFIFDYSNNEIISIIYGLYPFQGKYKGRLQQALYYFKNGKCIYNPSHLPYDIAKYKICTQSQLLSMGNEMFLHYSTKYKSN